MVSNFLAGIILGFDQLSFYYKEVGAQTLSLYQSAPDNYSIWSLGWRIFSGTHPASVGYIEALPLLFNPLLAKVLSIGLVASAAVIGLIWAVQARDFDFATSILLCSSILVNPVAWSYYYCWLLIPLVVSLRKLAKLSFPDRETFCLSSLFLLLFLPHHLYSNMASLPLGSYQPLPIEGGFSVSFWASLFTWIPVLALINLLSALRKLDRLGCTG